MSNVGKEQGEKTTFNERNYNIDFVRVIFALWVVVLHTSPFIEYNFYLGYAVCHVYSRLAVPFFAALSGYYLLKDYSVKKALLYIKKITLTYVFWNSLSCLIDICFGYTKENIVLFLIKAFFLQGQHALWYMLALIYTVILTIIVYILNIKRSFLLGCSFVLLLLGILTNAYGNLFLAMGSIKKIFGLLSADIQNGLPFVIIPYFSMGYVINRTIERRAKEKRSNWQIFCFCILAYTAEVFFVTIADFHLSNVSCFMTYPTIYFLIIALLVGERQWQFKRAPLFGAMANVIYYAHSLMLYLIPGVMRIFFKSSITQTMLFFVIVIILLPVSYVLAYNKKRIAKWIL